MWDRCYHSSAIAGGSANSAALVSTIKATNSLSQGVAKVPFHPEEQVWAHARGSGQTRVSGSVPPTVRSPDTTDLGVQGGVGILASYATTMMQGVPPKYAALWELLAIDQKNLNPEP